MERMDRQEYKMRKKVIKTSVLKGATEIKLIALFTDKGGYQLDLSGVWFKKKPKIVVYDGRLKIIEAIANIK